MAKPRSELVGALFGIAAGVGAFLPPPGCAGSACGSCLACVGLGAAVAPALLLGLVRAHRHGKRSAGETIREVREVEHPVE